MNTPTAATDACPRCGAGFHCGANDAVPCACTTPRLDEETLADLRKRFNRCLCLACLREIATSNPGSEPAPVLIRTAPLQADGGAQAEQPRGSLQP